MRWLVIGQIALWAVAATGQVVDPVFGAFERPYKLALFATSMGDVERAGGALGEASALWWPAVEKAAERHESAAVEAMAIEVAGRLEVARWQLDAGHAGRAHETLEGVRMVLARFREGHHCFVLNDKLTGFHEPMEHAVLTAIAAEGRTADEVLATLRAVLPELRSRWAAAQALLEGDPSAARLAPLMGQVEAAVGRLATALVDGQAPAAVVAAKSLKPAFRDLFLGVESD